MKLSAFGKKFSQETGISTLMEDLGAALREHPQMCFMGGGNPARIPKLEEIFTDQLQKILRNSDKTHHLFGVYQSPQGDAALRAELAKTLHNTFGWPITANNIALSNGSQSAFYTLFQLFAGPQDASPAVNDPKPQIKQIALPLAPEYLGYADIGLQQDFFQVTRPDIELIDEQFFKYHVDFNALSISQSTAALCVSRPSNPTGNVLTDDEINQLQLIAKQHDIPLIVDGAYGAPFPGIIFSDITPSWTPHTIIALSLSKLGLPGTRTGIVIAREDIIEAFARANTVLSLAPGNLGPTLMEPLLKDGSLMRMGKEIIRPFYEERLSTILALCKKYLKGLDYRIHKPEGAIFLWLWFKNLPVHSQVLYERLKQHDLLVVPGHHFFMGLENDPNWSHGRECIRITYAQPPEVLEKGIKILAQELKKLGS